MKFTKLSPHFWRVDAPGLLIVGTWSQIEEELKEVKLCKK